MESHLGDRADEVEAEILDIMQKSGLGRFPDKAEKVLMFEVSSDYQESNLLEPSTRLLALEILQNRVYQFYVRLGGDLRDERQKHLR